MQRSADRCLKVVFLREDLSLHALVDSKQDSKSVECKPGIVDVGDNLKQDSRRSRFRIGLLIETERKSGLQDRRLLQIQRIF